MRRMRNWAPWIFVATLGVATIASASAGAATSPSGSAHPSDSLTARLAFCREIGPAVIAGQRLPHLVSEMRTESLGAAKASLLANARATERPFRSLQQMHGLPATIKTALRDRALATDRFQTALRNADSKQEVRTALMKLLDGETFPSEARLLHCERQSVVH